MISLSEATGVVRVVGIIVRFGPAAAVVSFQAAGAATRGIFLLLLRSV